MDYLESFQLAVQNGEKAVQLAPGTYKSYIHLGSCYLKKARTEWSRGENPSGSVQEVLRYNQKALQIHADSYVPYAYNGEAYLLRAQYQYAQGDYDPETIKQAEMNINRSFELEPVNDIFVHASHLRSDLQILQARKTMREGGDPKNYFRAARDAISKTLLKGSDDCVRSFQLAKILQVEEEWHLSQKTLPQSSLQELEKELKNASCWKQDPATLQVAWAEFHLLRAKWKGNEKDRKSAREKVSQALEMNPHHHRAKQLARTLQN
jgi:tetratricopeptide (TPR) repeat protein